MDYTKKIISYSNYWYNDGLKKAQIRDLSGAVVSLRKSLQFNKGNIEARNLLGLVYYGRGEISEALVEWILSKNFSPNDNPADRYLRKIQKEPKELERMNQAVRKYNQALMYCEQNGEDLAVIQLKRAIAEYPGLLKAYQLLALIYLHTGQYAKARQILKEAKKLDITNEITLHYIQEVTRGRSKQEKKAAKPERKKAAAVEYNLGNETIIQPVHSAVKALTTKTVVAYLVTGILIGAALVWFLISPASRASQAEKHNQEILEYSQRINTMDAQISALTRTLDQYRGTDTASGEQTAASTADSYEYLMVASNQLESNEYTHDLIADTLYNVNRSVLGSGGQAMYDYILSTISEAACVTKYEAGVAAIESGEYAAAVDHLSKVVWMNESYADGSALLNLGFACKVEGDLNTVTAYLSRIKELYPGTDVETQANVYLEEIAQTAAQEAEETKETE
ncbi:MAG: tetratricopeptide repeat protein [Ruminococcus sp.]|nr:tetratricopeptide repeat protein [Ruminococcus sp.]